MMLLDNLRSKFQVFHYEHTILSPCKGRIVTVELFFLSMGATALLFPPVEFVAKWLFWISTPGLVFSLGKLAYEALWVPPLELEEPVPDARVLLREVRASTEEEADGFQIIKHTRIPGHAILFSRHFNRWLRKNPLHGHPHQASRAQVLSYLREEPKSRAVILRDEQREAARRKGRLSNDRKVGVASPIHSKSKSVACFRTDYYSSVLTNDVWIKTFRITRGTSNKPLFVPNLRELVESSGSDDNARLLNLGRCRFNNHLGANTLAVTTDNVLQLWRQSKRAHVSGGLIASSGSGSCDWQDTAGARTLNQIAITAMNREVWEESLKRGSELEIDQMIHASVVIGYFRDLHRGGLPGFLGLTRLKVSAKQLTPDVREVTRAEDMQLAIPVPTFEGLCFQIEQLLKPEAVLVSRPLWANCLALRDLIEDDPAFVREFLGYA